uniref:Uncharacterized protein n=1 Tax=Chenopodium quinoa TaxID=63459 RepID=A0A803N2P7_CHEQI
DKRSETPPMMLIGGSSDRTNSVRLLIFFFVFEIPSQTPRIFENRWLNCLPRVFENPGRLPGNFDFFFLDFTHL